MGKIKELEKIGGEFAFNPALFCTAADIRDKTIPELFDMGCEMSRAYGLMRGVACSEMVREMDNRYAGSIRAIRAKIHSKLEDGYDDGR